MRKISCLGLVFSIIQFISFCIEKAPLPRPFGNGRNKMARSRSLVAYWIWILLVVTSEFGECSEEFYGDTFLTLEDCEDICTGWIYECQKTDKGTHYCGLERGKLTGGIIAVIVALLVLSAVITCLVCYFSPCCPCYRGFRPEDAEDDDETGVSTVTKKSTSSRNTKLISVKSPAPEPRQDANPESGLL